MPVSLLTCSPGSSHADEKHDGGGSGKLGYVDRPGWATDGSGSGVSGRVGPRKLSFVRNCEIGLAVHLDLCLQAGDAVNRVKHLKVICSGVSD